MFRTVPKAFLTQLRVTDAKLNVRWGCGTSTWVLERSCRVPEAEAGLYLRRHQRGEKQLAAMQRENLYDPTITDFDWKVRVLYENFLSARAGRRIILFAEALDARVLAALYARDSQRFGGFEAYMDRVEDEERREAVESKRLAANQSETLHKETYDVLNFIERKRQDRILSGGKTALRDLLN